MRKDKIIAYTDGGCLVNPGGKGGFGVVILDGDDVLEISQGYIRTTNNRMELMAILAVFENIEINRDVTIYSDSKYAIGVASGNMRASKNLDLVEQLLNELKSRKVDFVWVKGHNGNIYNERCDKLATEAMNGALIKDIGYTD